MRTAALTRTHAHTHTWFRQTHTRCMRYARTHPHICTRTQGVLMHTHGCMVVCTHGGLCVHKRERKRERKRKGKREHARCRECMDVCVFVCFCVCLCTHARVNVQHIRPVDLVGRTGHALHVRETYVKPTSNIRICYVQRMTHVLYVTHTSRYVYACRAYMRSKFRVRSRVRSASNLCVCVFVCVCGWVGGCVCACRWKQAR